MPAKCSFTPKKPAKNENGFFYRSKKPLREDIKWYTKRRGFEPISNSCQIIDARAMHSNFGQVNFPFSEEVKKQKLSKSRKMTASQSQSSYKSQSIDYEYDVFVSLAHVPKWMEWMDDIVLPILRDELWECMGSRKPNFYVARHEMLPGDTWPVELAQSHARSRTLLALCTNVYRNKAWCQLEFSMMRAREQKLDTRSAPKPLSLLVPVIGFDCEDSPEFIKGIEPIDLSDYAFPELPTQCEARIELRKRILLIAKKLADGIKRCPPYDPQWEALVCDEFMELFQTRNRGRGGSPFPGMDGR
jgi:hypothetical protein